MNHAPSNARPATVYCRETHKRWSVQAIFSTLRLDDELANDVKLYGDIAALYAIASHPGDQLCLEDEAGIKYALTDCSGLSGHGLITFKTAIA